ncbi:TetR-like C-terminal domain-containing protein [Microbacterium sp. ZW T5_56]|uniref:TetR-like C-terminal domain-containing protein n=1 Tax=Microbacterium sp. ZW T5_56 TaxID=3378081 RepID=UPI00385375E6
MARPPVYDDALRHRLLAETAEAIDSHGVDGFSLRAVTAAASTSTSAVYALFGSRDGLVAAVIDDAFASFGAAQHGAEADGLAALGWAYRDWALANPVRYRLMFGGALLACAPEDVPSSDGAMAPLIRTVTSLLPHAGEVDIRTRVLAIWAQVHGAVSLQLAGVMPDGTDWRIVFEAVVATIARDITHSTP